MAVDMLCILGCRTLERETVAANLVDIPRHRLQPPTMARDALLNAFAMLLVKSRSEAADQLCHMGLRTRLLANAVDEASDPPFKLSLRVALLFKMCCLADFPHCKPNLHVAMLLHVCLLRCPQPAPPQSWAPLQCS